MIELRAKVGSRGQIVIPKAIREMFQIHAEEIMIFRVEKDEILIRKEDGAEILKKLFSLFPDKLTEPEDVDWKEMKDSMYEERMKRTLNNDESEDVGS